MKWEIKMCICYLLGRFKRIKLRLKQHLFVHISVIWADLHWVVFLLFSPEVPHAVAGSEISSGDGWSKMALVMYLALSRTATQGTASVIQQNIQDQ